MSGQFNVVETSISQIHDAMKSNELTCEELVMCYLDRIEAYDQDGPKLKSIISINPNAINRAAKIDKKFAKSGLSGPLHGIPILVKDQAMTAGLRTTFGSQAFEDYIPSSDATIISNLKNAGAIILGKTNLPDFAAGDAGYSSVLGQTINPYATDRDPGGSSAGTGAAVAANLCTVGIGEDTGGSIRVPSANCNLFGIRVTTGLISRSGLSPLIKRQDTAGPMARTVEDLVRVLDILVGYDPNDTYTTRNKFANNKQYLESIEEQAIEDAKIGVLRQAFGDDSDPKCRPVNNCVQNAIDSIQSAGATIIDPIVIDNLDLLIEDSWLYGLASRNDINSFLSDIEDAPVSSFDELYDTDNYYEGLPVIDSIADGPEDPTSLIKYWKCVDAQTRLQEKILRLFLTYDLDAIVFPDVEVPARSYDILQNSSGNERRLMTNTYIASQSSCPAISMPAGFTDNGIPVGIELLGAPYSEKKLLSIAAGYEAHTETRQKPKTTPALYN